MELVTRLLICNSLGLAEKILACRHVARILSLQLILNFHYVTLEGRDSSVGIATHYGMDEPGIKSR